METKVNFIDELGTKASMVVLSHLSDVQTEINFLNELDLEINKNTTSRRIDFVKWLVIKLNGNLEQYIDCKIAYSEYLKFRGIK